MYPKVATTKTTVIGRTRLPLSALFEGNQSTPYKKEVTSSSTTKWGWMNDPPSSAESGDFHGYYPRTKMTFALADEPTMSTMLATRCSVW